MPNVRWAEEGKLAHKSARENTADERELSRFVVQRHRARTEHFDFRLEKDGVFKSWAVPKGLPDVCGPKRLAIQVEDHPLGFGEFEGEIPEDEYGAGTIDIWDRGTYVLQSWTESEIRVILQGRRHSGPYQLVRFPKGGERGWLIFRRRE